ncbi:MAG: YggS family pyridoxal phosphate-dependent enzyme [Deltaproteobacteria bacterium]|nr:YggS family pyridoxal phosphate-dependent enzyme [Deltaproteobacteria bacterium]
MENLSVKNNLEKIQKNIEKICLKKNLQKQKVTLVGISKQQAIEKIKEAYDVGLRHFGENKAQEFLQKYELLPKNIIWHFVGHLQKNKVKSIIDKVSFIHSLDSLPLALEIEKRASSIHKKIKCFIQINMGGETTKSGIDEKDLPKMVSEIKKLSHVDLIGLMCLPPYCENKEEVRPYFRNLKKLGKQFHLEHFSGGMSHDYEIAIEEGATFIRVGSHLFGKR